MVRAACRPLPAASCFLALGILHLGLLSCAKAPPAAPPALAAPALDPIRQLQSDLTGATQLPGVRHGSWAIAVQSLTRNERLFDLNPRTLMVPASIAKLVSVATAVDAVGWDYTFATTIRTAGSVSDSVLHGDLIVVGSGDPAIGGRGGDDLSTLVAGIAAAGIHRIDGRVVGVDDAFEDPRPGFAWSWDDLGYRTGALFGALNLAENAFTVTVTAGAAAGAPTSLSTSPDAQAVPLINRSVTGAANSGELLWPEMRPGETQLTIAGTIPAGGKAAALTVAAGNPTIWFAQALRRRLMDAGIEVTAGAVDADDLDVPVDPNGASIISIYHSHRLSEIVQPLLKESINLYAEAVQRLNGSGPPPRTNDQALAGMTERLLAWGVPRDAFQLVDGSGLSRRDVLSADALMTVLMRMYDATGASPWMTSLPVAGIDGTLAARMKQTPAENNLRAKTGTMSNVRSLAGYIRSRDGEPLAFVIMVNNFEGTGLQATTAIDTMAARLASFAR